MTDLLLQMAVSNLAASAALALLAWTVQRVGRAPRLAHVLWLMVLVSLVTPPLIRVPLIPVPNVDPVAAAASGAVAATEPAAPVASVHVATAAAARVGLPPEAALLRMHAAPATSTEPAAPPDAAGAATPLRAWATAFLGVWFAGSLAVLAWSVGCVVRFDRRLSAAAGEAPPAVRRLAAETAAHFGLRRVPRVELVDATVSPMLWWAGGRARIILPAALLTQLPASDLRWILAHEMAHLRRRDHLVRWLEWLAVVAFWWNPLAWWARRNLRLNEELCCDALVLETLESGSSPARGYARALMHVVEFLAAPALRPPALASAVNGGGILETRFTMIMTPNGRSRSPRWLTAVAVTAAATLLPIGFAYADADVEAVTKRLKAAVAAGELEPSQARLMLQTLKRTEAAAAEDRIRGAVENGRISREEAERRIAAIRKAPATSAGTAKEAQLKALAELERAAQGEAAVREEYERAMAEMKRMVERGRKTHEEALARAGDLQKKSREAAQRQRAEERAAVGGELAERAAAELRMLQADGRLSEAEVKQRMAKVKQGLAELQREVEQAVARDVKLHRDRELAVADQREIAERLERELDQAVANGRITPEQAERRLAEVRRRLASEADRARERDWQQDRDQDSDRSSQRDSDRSSDRDSSRSSQRSSDRDSDRSSDRDSSRSSQRSTDRDSDRSSDRATDRDRDRDRDQARERRAARTTDRAEAMRKATQAIEAELRALVEAGHLSEADARERLEMMKRALRPSRGGRL